MGLDRHFKEDIFISFNVIELRQFNAVMKTGKSKHRNSS